MIGYKLLSGLLWVITMSSAICCFFCFRFGVVGFFSLGDGTPPLKADTSFWKIQGISWAIVLVGGLSAWFLGKLAYNLWQKN